jgi:AMP phosphorylase
MELKIKFLKWSTGFPVAMLNKKTAEKIGAHTRERISIRTISDNPKEMEAIPNLSSNFLKDNEIAVSSEIKIKMNLHSGQKVNVEPAPEPKSILFIKKKLNGGELNDLEIDAIIHDITDNSLSEPEIALFVSAMYKIGMNMKEVVHLTKAILKTGDRLFLKSNRVADKHSIGGIAGRTTPIVVSICASAGLIMPKTSSRAITTPAGTADAIETLAKVDFKMSDIKKIVEKTNACIVFGGGLGMVPADAKIILVEKQLDIDPTAMLLASIMSKKLAVGSDYILIHIPYGKTAKVSKIKALALAKKFEYIGRYFKKKIKCVLTYTTGPIGNGVGPILEMIDVIDVLKRKSSCYKLEETSIFLAGNLLEMTNMAKKGTGEKMAKKILDSGKAFDKFKEIIKAQHGSVHELFPGKFKKTIFATKGQKVIEIDNKKINLLARNLGCPTDKSAGLYLHCHPGDKINKGNKIITLYSESRSRLEKSIKYYVSLKPIVLK